MKNLLLPLICIFSAFGFSQLTLKKSNGTIINNNDVLNFATNINPGAYLGLKILNSSPNEIYVKANLLSMTNTDGTGTQLCFGDVCVANIQAGNTYPSDPAIIPPNGQNGNFDHFLNENAGTNTSQIVEYVFRFFMINSLNQEVGNSVTFTYRYSPNLAQNVFTELQDLNIQLKSTLVSNNLEISTLNPIKTEISDFNGRMLNDQQLLPGSQTIDVSNYKTGIYLLKITTENNKQSTIKFIKN